LIEAEVALGKRIETWCLEAHVAAHAHPNGARLDEIELDARKQTFERAAAATRPYKTGPRAPRSCAAA
jgi:hypothetical protein